MKVFNAIQLAVLNVTSPIWLNLLANATFPLHTIALWIGVLIAIGIFIWSVIGFLSSIED
jgi:hypothetical protein